MWSWIFGGYKNGDEVPPDYDSFYSFDEEHEEEDNPGDDWDATDDYSGSDYEENDQTGFFNFLKFLKK